MRPLWRWLEKQSVCLICKYFQLEMATAWQMFSLEKCWKILFCKKLVLGNGLQPEEACFWLKFSSLERSTHLAQIVWFWVPHSLPLNLEVPSVSSLILYSAASENTRNMLHLSSSSPSRKVIIDVVINNFFLIFLLSSCSLAGLCTLISPDAQWLLSANTHWNIDYTLYSMFLWSFSLQCWSEVDSITHCDFETDPTFLLPRPADPCGLQDHYLTPAGSVHITDGPWVVNFDAGRGQRCKSVTYALRSQRFPLSCRTPESSYSALQLGWGIMVSGVLRALLQPIYAHLYILSPISTKFRKGGTRITFRLFVFPSVPHVPLLFKGNGGQWKFENTAMNKAGNT